MGNPKTQEQFSENMDSLIQRLNAQGCMSDIALSMGTQRNKSDGWVEHGSWRIPAGKPFNVDQAFNTLMQSNLTGHSDQ